MRAETSAAAEWLTSAAHKQYAQSELERLTECIAQVLVDHYTGHWYEEEPHRGSGFRALTCSSRLDPLLAKACTLAGVHPKKLQSALSGVLTVWVRRRWRPTAPA